MPIVDTQSVGGAVELELFQQPLVGELARAFVRTTLVSFGYLGDHDDVVLIVSELIDNAFQHGEGAPALGLTGSPDRVRVEVTDDGATLPATRPSGPTGGWGLVLVEKLSARWGTDWLDGGGKIVWCEIDAAGSSPDQA